MNSLNTEAYQSLGWILNHSEDGFFFLVATERMQQEIAARYVVSNVAIYDYKHESKHYFFNKLEKWLNNQDDVKTYFILNLQLALQEKDDIERLNFSRDMIARLRKNFIFCMTQTADDALAINAYDFYSYVKLRIFFQDEAFENPEEPEALLPRPIDKSTGIHNADEIDFEKPEAVNLSQAISLVNQSDQLCNEFRYRDALSCLSKARLIRSKLLGEEHPDTAVAYQKTANVYKNLYQFKEALEWYRKALTIREKVLGKEHPDTVSTNNSIAAIYRNGGIH